MANKIKRGCLEIDPAKNPAVLDTAAWDPQSAWKIVREQPDELWKGLLGAVDRHRPDSGNRFAVLFPGSFCSHGGSRFGLAVLEDGQQVFLELNTGRDSPLGDPVGVRELAGGNRLFMHTTDAPVLHRYTRRFLPKKGTRAMGATPRLGIGNRASVSIWPGVWPAMKRLGFAANAIQNSMRELAILEDFEAGGPPRTNYLFGFGTIPEGYTGSTFEGLWVAGVLEALKTDFEPPYGADADHIQVKRGADGLDRARKVLDAARFYSFYTLDVSDVLDYGAIDNTSASEEYLEKFLPDTGGRKSVVSYHQRKRKWGGVEIPLDTTVIGCLVGKYWRALDALGELYTHLENLKDGESFDLELSVDENPSEVNTCECPTREEELVFLLAEAERRILPVTHIAPNYGVEKGVDYRCPDGLTGLEERIGRFHRITEEAGIMQDFHSGDDLSSETRRAIGRATNGRNHFKISPCLLWLFADVLHRGWPELFGFWWNITREYVQEQASVGSDFARGCLEEYETAGKPDPAPGDGLFHHYHYVPLGRRDDSGRFLYREFFYTLPKDFYKDFAEETERLLSEVAGDVFP